MECHRSHDSQWTEDVAAGMCKPSQARGINYSKKDEPPFSLSCRCSLSASHWALPKKVHHTNAMPYLASESANIRIPQIPDSSCWLMWTSGTLESAGMVHVDWHKHYHGYLYAFFEVNLEHDSCYILMLLKIDLNVVINSCIWCSWRLRWTNLVFGLLQNLMNASSCTHWTWSPNCLHLYQNFRTSMKPSGSRQLW